LNNRIIYKRYPRTAATATRKSSERISGKISSKAERENWRELAELLAAELETAAARTNGVSNVPAFLTEHLSRRLSSKPDNKAASSEKQ
jgi:hypothetical protein